jgi:small neutral amino acid transporter SnatA (MarC family)
MEVQKNIEENKVSGKDGVKTAVIVFALVIIVFLLFYLVISPAMKTTDALTEASADSRPSYPIGKIFTVLFLMLGPFKIIGPFATMTLGINLIVARRIAILATGFAAIALLFAAFLGGAILRRFGIPLPVLALAAGLILFLVAIVNILQQFKPATLSQDQTNIPLVARASSFAFPTIVTPYGIAALVVFLALSPDMEKRLAIGAIVLAIVLINLIFMLITPYIFRILGIFLQILAAVLGVIQVALGLQIIYNSMREILK